MNWKIFIPNGLTLLNLFCGCCGIIFAFQHSLWLCSVMIGFACLFDFLDGFAARLLQVSGDLGKQLDSLADMVTFGVLPGVIMFQLSSASLEVSNVNLIDRTGVSFWLPIFTLLIPLFSCLRLAIFNIDIRQKEQFIGLPTPANAILIAGFPLILELQYHLNSGAKLNEETTGILTGLYHWKSFDIFIIQSLQNPVIITFISVILSLMLVSPFAMLSFKFKSYSFKENKSRYIFLFIVAFCMLLMILPYIFYIGIPFLDYVIIPLIILLYICYSIIIWIFEKKPTNS